MIQTLLVPQSSHNKILNCRLFVPNVWKDRGKTTKMTEIEKWDVRSILDASAKTAPYALIILNRPIQFEIVAFQQLWNEGSLFKRVTRVNDLHLGYKLFEYMMIVQL